MIETRYRGTVEVIPSAATRLNPVSACRTSGVVVVQEIDDGIAFFINTHQFSVRVSIDIGVQPYGSQFRGLILRTLPTLPTGIKLCFQLCEPIIVSNVSALRQPCHQQEHQSSHQ